MQLGNFLKGISFSEAPAAVGLDIGNFSVKLIQIKKINLGKEKSLSFAVVPIKDDGSPDRIIEAIKQAYKDSRIESKKVNISVCGPNIIMRYIILPLMKENDLSKSLEFELERYMPFKKEDAVIDYHILANLPNNQMLVLLVAVERRLIEERIKLIKDAGLEPQAINVDAFALMEAFLGVMPKPKSVTALLDIGYRLSKLVVLEYDVPYFSRDIEIGEYDIFQMISQKMNLDFNLAKELSYRPKEEKVKEIAESVKPTLDSLLSELSLSFEYCERDLGKKVDQLCLSAGGSKIKFLSESLGNIGDLKIHHWNPIQGFKVTSPLSPEGISEYSHLLAVAVGLALS